MSRNVAAKALAADDKIAIFGDWVFGKALVSRGDQIGQIHRVQTMGVPVAGLGERFEMSGQAHGEVGRERRAVEPQKMLDRTCACSVKARM